MRPVLAKFHWLPIRERLHYKMALLAYQGRVGLLPRYLSTLLSDCKPAWTLRSGFGAPLLQTRRVWNELARHSFGVAIPAVCNALPPALRLAPSIDTFKAGLKSNVFREAFYDLLWVLLHRCNYAYVIVNCFYHTPLYRSGDILQICVCNKCDYYYYYYY